MFYDARQEIHRIWVRVECHVQEELLFSADYALQFEAILDKIKDILIV